ncbi:MAG: MlaD family protein [Methylococcaceae bacterium]|nr:MlaD family protein [Methylococcaceae bacterium]
MSKSVNPFTIGAFLVGSCILLIAAILIFGGGQIFKQKSQFVIFFDSTLNGLNVGAPVKLEGVQIGTVKEIALILDPNAGRILKPVVVEINPEIMRDSGGQPLQAALTLRQRRENAKRIIEAGLKARLETQSLLTGLLYVEFSFVRDEPVNLVGLDHQDLPELPSRPSTVDEIRNTADEVMAKLRKLPLEEMVKDLADTLREVRDLMKSDDLKNSLAHLSRTLQETERLTVTLNDTMKPLLTNANGAVVETRMTLHDFRKEMAPVLANADKSLLAATRVLQES